MLQDDITLHFIMLNIFLIELKFQMNQVFKGSLVFTLQKVRRIQIANKNSFLSNILVFHMNFNT